MPEPRSPNLLEIKGLNVFYGRSHALQGVDLTLEHGVLSLVGSQRHGQDDALQGDRRADPGRERLHPFHGRGAHRPYARRRSRGSGSATCRRAGGCGPRSRSMSICGSRPAASRSQWTIPRIYDAFPRLGGAAQQSRQPALRRRAADAGHRARAASQSAAAGDGRADRGPRAGDRRPGRADSGRPR